MLHPRVEFISSFGFGHKEGEFRYAILAINGKVAPGFWVHESDWRKFSESGELERFLVNQAMSLLEEYGEERPNSSVN